MKYKDKLYFSHAIEVRSSGLHGYGVFATRDISKGEIIEECYGIMMLNDWNSVDDKLKEYVFATPPFKSGLPSSSIALGHAMIYNHDEKNFNVDYKNDSSHSLFIFSAAKDINKDAELLITYGPDSHCAERMRRNG